MLTNVARATENSSENGNISKAGTEEQTTGQHDTTPEMINNSTDDEIKKYEDQLKRFFQENLLPTS